jgi:hypothetical protein
MRRLLSACGTAEVDALRDNCTHRRYFMSFVVMILIGQAVCFLPPQAKSNYPHPNPTASLFFLFLLTLVCALRELFLEIKEF